MRFAGTRRIGQSLNMNEQSGIQVPYRPDFVQKKKNGTEKLKFWVPIFV